MIKTKKALKTLVSVFTVTLLFLTGCGSSSTSSESGAGKTYEMSVNNFFSSTHPVGAGAYEPWAQYVEEKTEGRIKVNITHGSTLGTTDSAYKDISSGVYDVAFVSASLAPDTEVFPLTIGTLPFAFPDAAVGGRIMEKFAQKHVKYEGFKSMGMVTTDPYMLFSKNKISSVEDMKNKKLRFAGKYEVLLIEDWGGVPVRTPIAGVYEAIQKTTIDGTLYSPIGGMGEKYYEVAPYLLNFPVTSQPLNFAMNPVFYDQLPEDLKKMLDEDLAPKLAELFTKAYTEGVEETLGEFTKQTEGKGGIVTLSPEEEENFKSTAGKYWGAWVEEANEKGYPGDEMMEDFKKLLEEEGLQAPI